jgi:nucleoside-diphosphate-sugar epimerase
MRIFSSAENWRRVARRISLTTCSADSLAGPDFCPSFAPLNGYDGPEILPISNERWIYACSKQLLDRVIWALGARGLDFTIFRPFNWFGPDQDDLCCAKPGSSRVVPQFLGHLLRGEPIQLVDGGHQFRTLPISTTASTP